MTIFRCGVGVRLWPPSCRSGMSAQRSQSGGQTGQHLLGVSLTGFDPQPDVGCQRQPASIQNNSGLPQGPSDPFHTRLHGRQTTAHRVAGWYDRRRYRVGGKFYAQHEASGVRQPSWRGRGGVAFRRARAADRAASYCLAERGCAYSLRGLCRCFSARDARSRLCRRP